MASSLTRGAKAPTRSGYMYCFFQPTSAGFRAAYTTSAVHQCIPFGFGGNGIARFAVPVTLRGSPASALALLTPLENQTGHRRILQIAHVPNQKIS